MKIYTKLLITILPLVFFFLIAAVSISYYFANNALMNIAEEWLSTRSSEAIEIIRQYETILHQYGLENVPANVMKARLDAAEEISEIKIGEQGYIMAIDTRGIIFSHPDKSYIYGNISTEDWFKDLGEKSGRMFFALHGENAMAIYKFFPEWNWFILAVSPVKELYGEANHIKPYLAGIGFSAAIIVSLALMLLTRHLLQPLHTLVKGAQRIGKGRLDTEIYLGTRDEFADLAKEFNQMSSRLRKFHEDLEHMVDLRTKELLILTQTLGREIQTRKIKESELEKASQVKNEFLANISHEIRTPLNSIIGFTELLAPMAEKNQEKTYLYAIQAAGRNLLSLINDILDLSKMEAGKFEFNPVSVNIHVLLDDIFALFRPKMKEKSLRFVENIDDQIPSCLLMDDIRFQQVMVNLLDNAVKFTDSGFIEITVKIINKNSDNLKAKEKISLGVSIKDTGIGIPEDQLNHIFDSFQQVPLQTSRKYRGTGLGLSISRQLVELMGGKIQVESKPGKGSVFHLFLPEIEISHEPAGIQNIGHSPHNLILNTQDSVLEQVAEKNYLSIKTLKNHCEENKGLKEQIHSRIFQLMPVLEEGINVSEIQKLIQNIIHIGNTFQIQEFTRFGQELADHAESFDIEDLSRKLKYLDNILQSLGLD